MTQADSSSGGTGPGGAKVHAHSRGAPSPDIPLAPVSCQFTDTGLERLFRVTDPECDAASFAALMLATAVLCGVVAAVSFYVHRIVDSLLMAAGGLFLLWVLLRWCLHRLAWGALVTNRGNAAAAVSPLQAARSNQAVARDYLREQATCLQRLTVAWLDASLCIAVMTTATLWAFLRAPDRDAGDSGWAPSLPATPSANRLFGVPVVAVLPVALGLDYVSSTVSQAVWLAVFVVCNFAWLWDNYSSLVYGGIMWASILVIAVQLGARRFATMKRSRWYVKNVLDVITASPAASSVTAHSPGRGGSKRSAPRQWWGSGKSAAESARHSHSGHSSPSSPFTPTHHRQPVVERLVSMLNRVRHETANPQIAADLATTLEILYENPDALTAGYTSADVQGLLDIDETTAAWMNQTLARRLPSFSAARRRQDVNKDKLRRVLQRQSSMDKESSDDEFDGVAGRARSFERDVNMPRVHSSSPVATPHGVVRRMLKQLHTWDFDIFEFNDVCHGRPLAYVLTEVLTRYNLIEKHQIDKKCLASFSNKLEWEYCYNPQRRNPYHGNVHAADVTQAVVHFLSLPRVQRFLDDLDVFSIVIAAAVHDFRHPGVTNNYLITTQSKLALRYNDMSVLENFHACEAFRCMRHRSRNILQNVAAPDTLTLRYTIIQCVLATDLALGPRYIAAFESRTKRPEFGHDDEDKLLLLQLVLKCADVSHATRPMRLHIRWSHLITEEFYLQGDTEIEMNIPVSPLCDRKDHNIAKSQRGFISFVVRPCFTPWSAFCKTNKWMHQLSSNFDHWQNAENSPHLLASSGNLNSGSSHFSSAGRLSVSGRLSTSSHHENARGRSTSTDRDAASRRASAATAGRRTSNATSSVSHGAASGPIRAPRASVSSARSGKHRRRARETEAPPTTTVPSTRARGGRRLLSDNDSSDDDHLSSRRRLVGAGAGAGVGAGAGGMGPKRQSSNSTRAAGTTQYRTATSQLLTSPSGSTSKESPTHAHAPLPGSMHDLPTESK